MRRTARRSRGEHPGAARRAWGCGRSSLLASRILVAFSACASAATALAAVEAPPLPAWAPSSASPPPFHLTADAQDRARATRCVAAAIYFEAADQPRAGREAVAQVILNRVRHPVYPKTICGVVYQGALDAAAGRTARRGGCQFTFACDGSEARTPDARGWRDAVEIAGRALDGFVADAVGASTHYHTTAVRPAWDAAMTPTRRIGAHQFYRFPGALGGVGALSGAYAGVEPAPPEPRLLLAAAVEPRTAPLPRATPTQTAFSVWGVPIALATPMDGAVRVSAEP